MSSIRIHKLWSSLSHGRGWIVVTSVFVLYLVCIILLVLPVESLLNLSIEKLGALGDAFGLLTALFSGLAFWVALFLLREQKEEFKKLVETSNYTALIQRGQLQPQFKASISQVGPQAESIEIEFTNLLDSFFVQPVLVFNSWGGKVFPLADGTNTVSFQRSVKFKVRRFDFRLLANRENSSASRVLKFYYIDISTHLVEMTWRFTYSGATESKFIKEDLCIDLIDMALLNVSRAEAHNYIDKQRWASEKI